MAGEQSTVRVAVEYTDPKKTFARTIDTGLNEGLRKLDGTIRGANSSFGALNTNARNFDAQLERANKRVLALGASVTIVYGTVRAFGELVRATAGVEKNLTTINTVFQLSARELDSFGKSLSNVAKQTGQALDEVSKAALEFSRQGLTMGETVKRTRDAMILVRLTGIDVTKAVDSMTAAVNTFSKVGLDSTQILNKLVAVDRAFAVSAKDLAEAFARVGSVADDANVSLDQFNGLVTAARQITSREGAVIGNSLKTIFTRLERSTTLEQIESLGVAIRDAAGNALPTITVFENLAKTYGTLTRAQQQQVAEMGAGVFQINQFKALLLDLGKANGVAAQATKISTNATNEALIANALLNNTLATSLQNLQTSATTAAAMVGKLSVERGLKGNISVVSLATDFISQLKSDGSTQAAEDFGNYFAESFLKGIGAVLAGPGSIFITKAITGLVGRTFLETKRDIQAAAAFPTNFVSGVGRSLGMGGRGDEISSLQTVNGLLAKGTDAERARYQAAATVAQQEAVILEILNKQVVTMARMGGAAAPAITSLRSARGSLPKAAGGYIPMSEESAAIGAGVGGAPSTARPVYLPSFNRGGGMRGIVANTSEFVVPGAAGGAIYNRDMIKRYGLPPGATPVAAGGFIPNAAESWYNVPSVYRSRPPTGTAFGIPAGTPMSYGAGVPGGGGLGAQGQGFGSIMEAERRILAQRAQNAEREAVVIATETQLAQAASRARAVGPSIFADPRQDDIYDPVGRAIRRGVQVAGRQGGSLQVTDTRTSEDYWAMSARNQARMQERNASSGTSSLARELAAMDRNKAALQREQVSRELKAQASRERLQRYGSSAQSAFLLGSFATGFAPEAKGGTLSGQITAAGTTGLQGGAIGSAVGSIFGPIGTLAGTLVGAFSGAVYGFISKSQKSFDELAKELNDANSARQQQLSGAIQFRSIQGNISEALSKGRKSDVIGALARQQAGTLSQMSPDMVKRLVAARGDEDEMDKIITEINTMVMKGASRDALTGGMKGLEDPSKLGPEGMKGLAQGFRNVVGDTGSKERSLLNRLNIAGGRFSSSGEGFALGGSVATAGQKVQTGTDDVTPMTRATFESEVIEIINSSALSKEDKATYVENIKRAKDEALIQFVEALSKAPNIAKLTEELVGTAGKEQPRLEQLRLLSLGDQIEATRFELVGQRQAQSAQTAAQIRQANPLLSPMDQLSVRERDELEAISDARRIKEFTTVSRGRGLLREKLRSNPVGLTNEAMGALGGLTSPQAFLDLQARLNTQEGKASLKGLATPEFLNAIDSLIKEMQEAKMIEVANTAAVKDQTEQQRKELAFTLSKQGGLRAATGERDTLMRQLDLGRNKGVEPEQLEAMERQLSEMNYRLDLLRGVPGGSESGYDRLKVRNAAIGSISAERRTNRATIAEARGGSRLITGGQLEGSLMGEAMDRGRQGDALGSFRGGFSARFEGLKQDMKQLAEVGAQVASSLEQNLGNAFGDFVTGAQKGKDAFRSFVLGVLNDSARAMASKAVQQLLGYILGSFMGGGGGQSGVGGYNLSAGESAASGGFIGLANGGRVPTLLTGGEYAFSPNASKRIGPSMLTGLNNGTVRKMAGGGALVRGGSGIRDDVPAMLAPGTFVVKKAMTERYGVPFLSSLANGGATATFSSGGGVGSTVTMTSTSMPPIRMAGGGMLAPNGFQMMSEGGTTTTMTAAPGGGFSGGGTFNIGVSITDQRTSSTSSSQSNPQGGSLADKQFGETLAARMKQVAVQAIEEQTRLGGILRGPRRA